jgi:hypothetical protein
MKSTPCRGGLRRRWPADGGTAPARIRSRFGYCLPICISLLLTVAAAMKGTTTSPPPRRWRAAPYLMVKDDALPPPSLAAARIVPMASLWRRQGGGEGCPRWRRLNRRPSRLGLCRWPVSGGGKEAAHLELHSSMFYMRLQIHKANQLLIEP